MKKINIGLMVIFVGSMFLTSCSTENNVLSQFSKRKYLKNSKATKNLEKYKAEEIQLADIKKIEKNAADEVNFKTEANNSTTVDEVVLTENTLKTKVIKNVSKIKSNRQVKKDFMAWKKEAKNVNFVEAKAITKNYESPNKMEFNSNSSSNIHPIVFGLLAFFLPPLAVYLFHDSITDDFWLDVILTILVIVPGIVYAFLVVFADVSIN